MLSRVAVVKRLHAYHHSADYVFWSYGITVYILNYLALAGARGRGPDSIKSCLLVSFLWYILCFKKNFFIFTAAGVVPCGTTSKRFLVYHQTASYMSWSFGFTEFSLSSFEIEFHISRCLGAWPVLLISLLVMNRFNLTESTFFIPLMYSLASKGYKYSELINASKNFAHSLFDFVLRLFSPLCPSVRSTHFRA